ncbi:porin [Cereibacter sphaeroides]|nr:porin [Cereibacter sphaeroides]
MKKILLASTALVLSAGLAHAQAVTITGEGRMGVIYDDSGFGGGNNWRQEQRLTLNFNVSVEADHGLTFGAWSRARMQSGGLGTANAGGFSPSRVWVESNGLRLTFGNIDGAIRTTGTVTGFAGGCSVGYVGGWACYDTAGLIAGSQAQQSLNVMDNAPVARLDYTFGATSVTVSSERGGSNEFGIRSTFGAFTVGLGYADEMGSTWAGDSVWTVSGLYDGGSWTVGALVANGNGFTNWSLQGTVELGGGSAYAFVGEYFDDSVYGVNYAYGLGGGATVMIGAEHRGGAVDNTVGSIGVAFTF